MKKSKTKFFASPFIMFGLIFLFALSLGFWLLIFFSLGVDGIISLKFYLILPLIGMGVCPILAFILSAHKGFSVFEISETGVKRSLFKVLKKVEMRWDEMYEIRCYGMISAWLFFSKNCLEGIPYNKIIKRKDVIQVECNKKMLDLIKEYTNKEIVNLPENFKSTNNTK